MGKLPTSDINVSLGRLQPVVDAVKLWLNYNGMHPDTCIILTLQADESIEINTNETPQQLRWGRNVDVFFSWFTLQVRIS